MQNLHVPKNLFSLLSQSTQFWDKRPCLQLICASNETRNYRDIYDAAIRCAARLRKTMELQKGDRVLIMEPNSPSWVTTLFGVAAAGCTLVPVHIKLSDQQVASIIQQTRPKVVLISAQRVPALKEVLAFIGEDSGNLIFYSSDDLSDETLAASQEELSQWAPLADDEAVILWTSGTTGEPKGVVLTHKNICTNATYFADAVPLDSDDRLYSVLPLAHVFELVVGTLAPLLQGASITYSSGETYLEDLARAKPTVLLGVPRLLEKLALMGEHDASKSSTTLGELQTIISGGAALPTQVADQLSAFGIDVLEGYGLTETGPVIAVNRRTSNILGTVGEPLACVETRITQGELEVRGLCVSSHFIQEGKSVPATDSDGWFATGDLAELQPSTNHLVITGRKKEILVLSTGEKIAPYAIEERLSKIPGVTLAMALGDGEKNVAALIVLSVSVSTDTKLEIVQKLKQEILKQIPDALKGLSETHQVRNVLFVTQPFTVEGGELTPTLKLRRNFIAEKHREQIQRLFGA